MNAYMRAAIIVPVYNGGAVWAEAAKALVRACKATPSVAQVLVVDSSSKDDSASVARDHGFRVHTIDSREFDHAGTRNMACAMVSNVADIAVVLTQDAILSDDSSIAKLLLAFTDPDVAVAYGRQLPHVDANPIAAHARTFNYPNRSHVADKSSRATMGLKAVFTSNSFAAYRLSVFRELGGFPKKSILSEDMYFAAKAAMAGYKIAYVAEAEVRHSHNYSPVEEFRRYFDIGVFQHDEAWIAENFGGAGGEGKRFLMSELRYLAREASLWIPRACLHNACKIVGYKLGKNYPWVPARMRPRLSMHKKYWQ